MEQYQNLIGSSEKVNMVISLCRITVDLSTGDFFIGNESQPLFQISRGNTLISSYVKLINRTVANYSNTEICIHFLNLVIGFQHLFFRFQCLSFSLHLIYSHHIPPSELKAPLRLRLSFCLTK